MELTINNMNNFCAIRAKAPVWRVPTNPSLKAGVSDRSYPRFHEDKSELGFSPDSAWSSKCRTTNLFRLFIVNPYAVGFCFV